MRTAISATVLASCLVQAVLAEARAQAVELTNEPSRSDLALYAMSKDANRAFPRKFDFPTHAVAGKAFGIDVSHHQGKIAWSKIAGTGVRFVYVKASQGERFFDGQFKTNWQALETLMDGSRPIRRGAYHFMSATADPEKQADNFLATVGQAKATDLPPCLDVEWDFPIKDKKLVEEDQWAKHSSDEIVRRIQVWLDRVEKATGKKPLIYTNASWWLERVGEDRRLAPYKLWVADYTSASLKLEVPRTPKNFAWSFWQLTDKGKIATAGLVNGLDVNVLSSDDKDFGDLVVPRPPASGASK